MAPVFNRKPSPSSPVSTQPTVGATLKARREQLGWRLHDISQWLKIKENFLEALEEEHMDKLPGTAYVLGFLRTYAKALGLDQSALVQQFKAQHHIVSSQPVLHFPIPESERGIPSSIWVALGCVLIVAAYAGWYHYSGGHLASTMEPADPASVVVEEKKPTADNISPQVAAIMPDSVGQDLASAKTGEVPSKGVPSMPETPSNMTPIPSNGKTDSHALDAPSPVGTLDSSTDENATAEKPLNTHPAIVLDVKRTAWVKIQDGDKTLLARIMKRGESWPLPADYKAPQLNFGPHGGEIALQVEGYGQATIQGRGKDVNGVVLTLENLKEKKLLQEAASNTSEEKTSHSTMGRGPAKGAPHTPRTKSSSSSGSGESTKKSSADELNARQLSVPSASSAPLPPAQQ